jgi:carboxypeptidase Q
MATHTPTYRFSPVRLSLYMEAENKDPVESRNIVAEITGSQYPEQVVLVSGHIDSWDVGQGAMDDAGPAFVALQALRLVKKLNLRPKRTLRWVGWTTEERGKVLQYR